MRDFQSSSGLETLPCRLLLLSSLSGSGEADPPHAVWAVHRVSGASSSSAAQQQCRESRRRGAACLHFGSHQTTRLLLQVQSMQTFLINTVFFLLQKRFSIKYALSLPLAHSSRNASSLATSDLLTLIIMAQNMYPSSLDVDDPGPEVGNADGHPHNTTSISVCLLCIVHVFCKGCWEYIWLWSWKFLHPRAFAYRQRFRQFRWVV